MAVEKLSFGNGCFAVVMNVLLELTLTNPYECREIYTFSLGLFYSLVHAVVLYVFWRRLNEVKFKEESDVEPKNKGFGEEKLKKSRQEGDMADLDALKGKEFGSGKENSPLKESSGEEIKDEVKQERAMHDVVDEEPKGKDTGREKKDKFQDDLEEFTEILQEDIGRTVGENYGKNLLKKVEKQLEMAKEKHREERRAWKERENDMLFSMISREITRAEIYRFQAKEKEEKLHRLEKEKKKKVRKLEEEKNELMGQLCAANVKSDIYREFLHDANMPNMSYPEFS